MLRLVPYMSWTFIAFGTIFLVTMVVVAVTEDPGAWGGVLFMFVWLGIAVAMFRTWHRAILEARLMDSDVVLRGLRGAEHRLRPGDVEELREQQFLPQPGYTKLTTSKGTFYLGPFEHKYELINRLLELRTDS